MPLKKMLSIILILIASQLFSQDSFYSSLTIPQELKKSANAVVRLNDVNVTLKSSSEMIIHKKRIITVLNKQGNDNVGAYLHYDSNKKIRVLEALIFDALGKQIKKIKKNGFKDVSAVDGGTLYSDSRVKYLEYTPISYPYTVEFNYETSTENTAFIPSFYPMDDYFVSVQSSSYVLNYSHGLTIRKKENNINEASIVAEVNEGKLYYKIKNFSAKKPEGHGPSFNEIAPKVLFASNQFTLEGVSAQVENWNDFGKWMYQDLIKAADDLPAGTIEMIQNLVKDEKDDIAKTKKIYQYVQDKVRYISVQVGIGGWKPFNASEVDRLSYGDCKALTNYTMSLLKAVNVESNYTVVFAGKSQRNIDKNFASIQGNHVILTIPSENETLWLECTSQKTPFGFIGDFTDDRDVLVITPEGGKIKRTKKYTTNENTQFIKGAYKLESDGNIEVQVKVSSRGIQYDDKYMIETKTERDLDKHYKNHWDYINNISMIKMDLLNDREQIEFTESIEFNASNYSIISGERMLVTVNALNRNTYVPDRYRNRRLPLKIRRGFKDVDEVEISLPEGYKIESLPNNKTIETKFGLYKMSIKNKDETTLIYKREFVLNDGEFPKEDYAAFRAFYKNVAKQDNAKLSLIKSL